MTATDVAGNATTATADQTYAVDTENPTVAVDIVDGALNDGDTNSVVTFAFSEAPGASFTESDIQVSAGLTLVGGSLTMVDATHYTATVTAADGFTGTATVSLAAGSYTDAALNLGLAGSDTVTVTRGCVRTAGTRSRRRSIPTAADRTTRQRSRLAARPFRSPTSM